MMTLLQSFSNSFNIKQITYFCILKLKVYVSSRNCDSHERGANRTGFF